VIIWANGWGWNNVAGETTTEGYKPGLIKWALNGPYIVVAANQWSVQESDLLECLQWITDQNEDPESDYYQKINARKIGLAGHSQGGGAVIKAGGDGSGLGLPITATVAMNPYGPAWVDPGFQDGPMLILGGANDTTTPPDSYEKVWEAVSVNGIGGINATLLSGTHNSEAWGVSPYPDGETMSNEEARTVDFVQYQAITELWWDYFLNDSKGSLGILVGLLEAESWDPEFACTSDFLPCGDLIP
jgi:dienelactone hydrolase